MRRLVVNAVPVRSSIVRESTIEVALNAGADAK